ncbi:MAG: DUF6443 domain-containing protein [Bacteroidales bacterium]|nr:DUF6443 domain-containing protein [Bacteroidales bacterium]
MKRIYNILLLLLVTLGVWAQSTDQNYILTRTYTKDDASTFIDQIQYFDGLGRPVETIQKGITSQGKDLVSMIQYDGLGRDYKTWLPVPATGATGTYVDTTAFFGLKNTQYTSAEKPYTLTEYEPSPLNRVTGQYGAGTAWYANSKKVATAYQTNIANEVAYYYVNSSNKLQRAGYYTIATLYKTVVTDEDGKPTTEYKDKLGQVVMKQNSTDVRTYYVNDDFGRLRYVIPPEAADRLTSDGVIEDNNNALVWYGYLYQYDERGNSIMKRLPGCDPIWMVYDKADRMVLSQDGNQRRKKQTNKKQWSVTKYDVFGRVLYTGITYIDSTKTLTALGTDYKTQLITETYDGSIGFYNTGYTCTGSITPVQPLTVNYYDNYFFRKQQTTIDTTKLIYSTPPLGFDPQYTNTKGLMTGSRTYILDNTSTNYTATALYYDDRGRVVQSHSSNHLGGFDVVYNHYSFTGKVLQTLKNHNIAGTTPVPELYTYTYDNAERQKITTYKYNSQTPVVLSNMSYDELGRLQYNYRHTNADTVRYTYNIRNWPTLLQSGAFKEELFYNGFATTKATPCYNGNIAYSTWTYGTSRRAYTYVYDQLNRLTNADGYQLAGSSFFNLGYNEAFTFDKMGNIMTLQRKKGTTLIDNLGNYNSSLIAYSGNQMMAVTDYAGSQNQYATKEYNNKNLITNDFAYDKNGNMTMDLDRDIVTIRYNILNLPDTIQFKNGNQITNKYDASGRKLKTDYFTMEVPLSNPMTPGSVGNWAWTWDVIDETGTDYIDNFEYTTYGSSPYQHDLSRVGNAEGYYSPSGTAYSNHYLYYRKDHTGDNREVWDAITNTTVQRTQYYASGLPWDAGLGTSVQNRKYNGKEFIEMHGYDVSDLGWRTLHHAKMRFDAFDPSAEKDYSTSPYAFCGNNPVNRIDPDGLFSTSSKDIFDFSFQNEGLESPFQANLDQYYRNHTFDYQEEKPTTSPTITYDSSSGKNRSSSKAGDNKAENKASAVIPVALTIGEAVRDIEIVIEVGATAVITGALAILAVTLTGDTDSRERVLNNATDSGKNERHGDRGRTKTKVEKQLQDLEAQLQGATGTEKKKIKQKIKNIEENAAKNEKGEEHSRGNKR